VGRSSRVYESSVATSGDDHRSPFRRDRDRILYSIEFQRLVGVTQVASPTERFPVHNRLTHTLKVAQVGRSIAERLLVRSSDPDLASVLDPDVIDAACLAHDLGHPPFGHNTEKELDRLVAGDALVGDGFEGNAQTFRIVASTSVRNSEHRHVPGLNLTAATLNAILKYPYGSDRATPERRKCGYYQSEADVARFARSNSGFAADNLERSLGADVMNLADDISYAVHDVEDFTRAGLIPAAVFVDGSTDHSWFLYQCETLDPGLALSDIQRVLGSVFLNRFRGTESDLAQLAEFRSDTVNRFITAIWAERSSGQWHVRIPPEVQVEIRVLQALTRAFVIDSPGVQSQRYGQRRIIRELFTIFEDAAAGPHRALDLRIYPPLWEERLQVVPENALSVIRRTIADYIASMTENQVIDTFQKLTGHAQGSVADPLL
jgi:dGTPase